MFSNRKSLVIGLLIVLIILVSVFYVVPQAAVFAGNRALMRKEGSIAGRYFTYALRLNPWRTDLYEKLGKAEFFSGRYQEAISWYEKAASYVDNKQEYFWQLGHVYYSLKRYDKAIEFYQNAILTTKPKAKYLLSLSSAYLGLGDLRSARKYATDALTKSISEGDNVTHAKALNNLVLANVDEEGKPNPGAARIIESTRKLWDAPFLDQTLGYVYEKQGNIPAAIDAYEKFLSRVNRNDPAMASVISETQDKVAELKKNLGPGTI